MSGLQLKQLRKAYGLHEVIKGVDLVVEPKEFVVFVGPSGCGKSTLLRMIAGLEDITGGDLTIGGTRMNDVDASKRGIAMVFQSYALYPHMTVRENMGFALKYAGESKEGIVRRVAEAARILELDHLMDRKPRDLSGGQRQRVAIGRAIVRHPDVFLFDEPLSNLDAELRVQMRIEIARLHKELQSTIIYVTHDQVEAMTLADKIVVLKDGLVQQIGSPMELYHNPVNEFVAGFLGAPSMNFLDVEVVSTSDGHAVVKNASLDATTVPIRAGTPRAGQRARLGIRPQYLVPTPDQTSGQLHGAVMLTERLGSETVLEVRLRDGTPLIAALSKDAVFSLGTEVNLGFNPAMTHLFAA